MLKIGDPGGEMIIHEKELRKDLDRKNQVGGDRMIKKKLKSFLTSTFIKFLCWVLKIKFDLCN